MRSLLMNTPDGYAHHAEQAMSSTVVTGELDFAQGMGSAGVYALLAVAAAVDRLADAVSEVGTPPTYQPPRRR
jgi:hypothetical protein